MCSSERRHLLREREEADVVGHHADSPTQGQKTLTLPVSPSELGKLVAQSDCRILRVVAVVR